MIEYEGCYGCSRKENKACALIFPFNNKRFNTPKDSPDIGIIIDCPCAMCIVKVVCKKTCDDRLIFWKNKGYIKCEE